LILVDTSVWIDHLHKTIPALAEALEREDVLTHPFVVGELACGHLTKRREVLDLISTLPTCTVASNEEALQFVERHRLMSKGIGLIDVHLLASVMLTPATQLWSTDKRLATVAAELGIATAAG
jgi:predicted nucleic acid-binding protein